MFITPPRPRLACWVLLQVMNKFNDILEQFAREIDQTSDIFERHKVGAWGVSVGTHARTRACIPTWVAKRVGRAWRKAAWAGCHWHPGALVLFQPACQPASHPPTLPVPPPPAPNTLGKKPKPQPRTPYRTMPPPQDSPPVTKNQPPVAGAIKWARCLLARLKQTMAKLLGTEEEIIRTTELGQGVEAKFKAFARAVMGLEKRWFGGWSDSINGVAMQHLKQTIFRRSAETGARGPARACVRAFVRWRPRGPAWPVGGIAVSRVAGLASLPGVQRRQRPSSGRRPNRPCKATIATAS